MSTGYEVLPEDVAAARGRARGWHNVVGATGEELAAAELQALFAYGDIIDLPAHVSTRHPRQPRDVRAAQFAPFAALTGFGDVIEEAGRLTQERLDLAEDEEEGIAAALREVVAMQAEHPCVEIVHFVEDGSKAGGAYVCSRGRVERVDEFAGVVVLAEGVRVPVDLIRDVRFV